MTNRKRTLATDTTMHIEESIGLPAKVQKLSFDINIE